MVSLEQHYSSMEEMVRTLLQNQDTLEGPSADPLDLMKAYKDKLLEEMWKQQDSLEGPLPPLKERRPNSPGAIRRGHGEDYDETNPILERLRALEVENSALTKENDNQRKQYERCLDEVANQVVQALLTQKDLKEECVKLRTRVFDLEQQNRILNVLFQQRVKTSTEPISQEVQRNGKASVPAGRWPSLLSLTCPRSSCSGSEASLSSASTEYSSGSHTWAEGRRSSMQSVISREKRMSAGSESSNRSVPAEQPDLNWKEGHILKGLKRLQMRSPAPKETSSLASTSHFKDCMTSNEGIYSLGVKGGPHGVVPKLALAKGNYFKPGAGVSTLISDSDDAEDELPQSQARESCAQPIKETLHLEGEPASELGTAEGGKSSTVYNSQEEPVRLVIPSNSFSPIKDVFLLEGPTLKPGLSPTESPNFMSGLQNKNWIEKDKLVETTRHSYNLRSESVKQPQNKVTVKHLEARAREVSLPIQYAAARALSWVSEARQRSASMDTKQYREPSSQGGVDTKDYTILQSRQRKTKPTACDSARKAFILRHKSADGGPDQAKLHQPLRQKLIKVNQRAKNRSNPPGPSGPRTKINLSKAPGPAKASVQMTEKGETASGARTSGPLENTVHGSPSSSPQKLVKVFEPPVLNDCPKSTSKVSQPVSKLPSRNDCGVKGPNSNNSACSPLKQRQQDQHSDSSRSDIRSPSPPLPPGWTTSLLIRPGYGSLPQAHKPVVMLQTSSTVKATARSTKPPSSHQSSVLQMQPLAPNKMQDTHHMAPKMGIEVKKPPKWVPAKVYHPLPTSTTLQESKETDSSQSSMNRTVAQASHQENSVPFVLQNQDSSPVSQQGNGEPQSTELLPQASASLLCHDIVSISQHSVTRAVNASLPVGSKTNETTPKLDNNFAVITAIKGVQTFDTFNQDTYRRPMMHCVNAAVAKAKARRKLESHCSSLEEAALPPVAENGVTLDWGFDEESWLFKRSVSVSTRPPLHPVMGMNGAKARSQSFGARYMDRPNISRSGNVCNHIKTNSGSSLNSLGDVFRSSMSCSNSYNCPRNKSHNNFMIEEDLPIPLHLEASSDRFGLKHQRVNSCSHLRTEKQSPSTFYERIHGEPERQSNISTIEEKVMMGIEENLQKSQQKEKTTETKQKSGSLSNWFGFRKSKLPALIGKKGDSPRGKEERKEPKLGSLLGGKQAKFDKKKERKKSEGHQMDGSVGKRDSQDTLLVCLSMASLGAPGNSNIQGQTAISGDTKTKIQRMNLRTDNDNRVALKSPSEDHFIGSGCKMRTLDSGIGTFPLLGSSSLFSSILHLLPKSTSAQHSLSPPSAPSSSSEEVPPSPLPRWRVPSGSKDHLCSQPGLDNSSLSDTTVTLVQSVPYPTLAFLQPVQSLSESLVTCASVCDTQSKLPRLASGSGCKMRTLDSGIGTFPLLDSSSLFSSILHLLPKSTSAQHSLSPPSAPSSSSEEVSPSPLPRWRVPSGSKDHLCSQPGLDNSSLSDTTVTLVQSVPYPTLAFLQPVQSLSEPLVTCASVCDTQSKLPRLASAVRMT
ncbi:nck-associated protein 5 [Oncorhynchus kisutch]|uniref:Nck-associated protein 5-like n=1 Tax=Oncorhynchus kisutch TaxID=8019 RepID=A0A8C7F208_ONCKI|nr:nck-associated protein 5-like [Oncorhynchus kisutch]XP_031649669.1 nck-associated protein 5-like [Oncorhynchus kisutch]